MLRIIAGKYRSIPLHQPPLTITRCTTDRVREAIFSSIQTQIAKARVLDGFAGSGAMAIEALSRGAQNAVCVDVNPAAVQTIRINQQKCHITGAELEICQTRLEYYLAQNPKPFDLIFLDPPFAIATEALDALLEQIIQKRLLATQGMIILETSYNKQLILPKQLTTIKQRTYGKSTISFLQIET